MLPEWPPETVLILATAGATPHAIPVSATEPIDEQALLIALASSRTSLARLRAHPQVALVIIARGDLALTAHGRASVLEEVCDGRVVAVRVDIDQVHDHTRPDFVIEDGVRWRWTDPGAHARDREVRAELGRIARTIRDQSARP